MPSPARLADALERHALTYPETRVDHPWGETAVKVREKAFLFLGKRKKKISFSLKLPSSREFALDFPFAEPTHYGLGRHGWVTVSIEKGDELPLDVLKKWIDESFRAVAPKSLVRELDSPRAAAPLPARRPRGKR
ncbi:MAG TPA: MmcQ/YjbR family DNA-binding protein [Thermoanaerobaculia bacterium]|nr:MmcQ/YjbR family DNA-binding protein [Thermoanaerobaculia bacterium]